MGESALAQLHSRHGDYGRHGCAHAGEGAGNIFVFTELGIAQCKQSDQHHRRYGYTDDGGDACNETALRVTEQVSHISDHETRQRATDGCLIQHSLLVYEVLFLHKILLHLCDNTETAAESEPADLKEIEEQFECDLRVIFNSLHNYILHKISRIINTCLGHNRVKGRCFFMHIKSVTAREILNSRGYPAVEARVETVSGISARAGVPSGASTGAHEAHEKLDGGGRLRGRGMRKAVENVCGPIAERLTGMDAGDQQAIDEAMCALDGTENLSVLGANATLAVSIACAKAAARTNNQELFEYLGGAPERLPVPMMNVINGGAHAGNNIDIQEFMLVPLSPLSTADNIFMCAEVYHALRSLLKEKHLNISVGDEGGFAPDTDDDERALELMEQAVLQAGLIPGRDIGFALDIAASAWLTENGDYLLPKRGRRMTREALMNHLTALADRHPIISMEDPLHEDDFGGFAELRRRLGRVLVVGDDLFVTNRGRVEKGAKMGSATALLMKPNQAGTLTRALDAARTAQAAGMEVIVSHRSGETNSSVIADIGTALGAGYIKAGAPCRGERVAKYNRLMAIADILKK